MIAPKPIELKPGDKVLISRSDRLGDLILALPFVETMKLRYPECEIDVLASLYASPILDNNRRIDGILRVQNDQLTSNKLYKKDFLHRIKMAQYNAVVALYPERRVSHLFYKAAVPTRIGTAGRFHSIFYNHHLMHSRKENRKHEYEYNLDFLRFFRAGETVNKPRVYPLEKERKHAYRILEESGIDPHKAFAVLHPGSGGSAERWPLRHFMELYRMVSDQNIQVVISGSEKESLIIRKRAEEMQMPIKTIAGETDLRTLAAALSLATVVVANSTGPLHLAVAVDTRVVGLYPGRKVMSPMRWGPLGKDDRVIQPTGDECTCPPKQCTCMELIQPAQVAEAVRELCR